MKIFIFGHFHELNINYCCIPNTKFYKNPIKDCIVDPDSIYYYISNILIIEK